LGNAFGAQELHVTTAATRRWHETIAFPFRAVRQILKSRRIGHVAEKQEFFRTAIKQNDLKAEQMEQDLLAAAAIPDQRGGEGTAKQNVRAYLEMMAFEPSQEAAPISPNCFGFVAIEPTTKGKATDRIIIGSTGGIGHHLTHPRAATPSRPARGWDAFDPAPSAIRTIAEESDISTDQIRSLTVVVHSFRDISAAISSGSFHTRGMLVALCLIKTLSGIADSSAGELIVRAIDVYLLQGTHWTNCNTGSRRTFPAHP